LANLVHQLRLAGSDGLLLDYSLGNIRPLIPLNRFLLGSRRGIAVKVSPAEFRFGPCLSQLLERLPCDWR
jgi:hypothetical protein